jgi:CheY-like chemotaxis protein
MIAVQRFQQEKTMSDPVQPVPGRAASLQTARFLLVEDHHELAEATTEFLRRLGMDVCVAGCSKEALAAGPGFRPDIILCDMRLPDMTGIEAARAFRANPDTKEALIVIYTAMAEREVRTMQKDLSSGAVDLFMAKPVTREKVQQLLALCAARRGVG